MTAPDGGPQVEIRPPQVVRVISWVVASGALLLVVGPSAVGVVQDGDWGTLLLRLPFVVPVLVIASRTSGTMVRTTPDGRLLVRNFFRARSLARSEIEDVRRASGRSAQGAGLELLLRDGTVLALQATPLPGLGVHQRDLQAHQERLRRWLRS